MKKSFYNVLNVVLCFLLISCLFGCSNSSTNEVDEISSETQQQEQNTNDIESNKGKEENDTDNNTKIIEEIIDDIDNNEVAKKIIEESEDSKLSEKQKNSIAMVNYLTYTTAKILKSTNSKLYLEEVYSDLMSGTYPNAIDDNAQDYMDDIFRDINDFRMINEKRNRLKYIYEQNQASSIRSALPSPISILNVVQAGNPLKMVASLAYMAVDSISNYESAIANNELIYLTEDWKLDDEEFEAVTDLEISGFDYMVDVVQETKIDGDLTLDKDSIEYLVELENMTNKTQKLKLLIKNEETYKAFGKYWIILARSYYENENYEKCIEATNTYIRTQPRIFKKDNQLANLLPLTITSLKELYNGDELIQKENTYLDLLKNNINETDPEHNDWPLKYFCAVAYIDLYKATNDSAYLEKAYDNVESNALNLINNQGLLNKKYLADVKEKEPEKGATKADKKALEEYNKNVKEIRKTELPPVDEKILINLDLMFSVAKQLNISQTEKNEIDRSLHENNDNLFLVDTIEKNCWFNKNIEVNSINVFDGKKIVIPANYVCSKSRIVVEINDNGNITKIDDWQIDSVKRKGDTTNEFIATYSSKNIKKIDYKDGNNIVVRIYPYDEYYDSFNIKYNVTNEKIFNLIPNIKINYEG